MKHKDCGIPKEGLDVPRYIAEQGGCHCKCCGSVMKVEEVSSIGMQQLGMFRVYCEGCP